MKSEKKRFILLALLIFLVILLYFLWFKDSLTFERLKAYSGDLYDFVQGHMLVSVIGFIFIYVVVAGLSLPGCPILAMSGAVVFGVAAAAFYVNIGATIGAVTAFSLSRYLVGDWVQARYKDKLAAFNRQVEENGVYYLLTLRFMPLFPFTWINLFSGLTKMPLFTFIWTTSLGILPGTLVITYTGSQLGRINSPEELFSSRVLLAFFLLSVFALLPVIVKRVRKKRL
ncbi:MAG: VTT domain-containing protein [Candidatus Aminicenantes bacterium]|jgi:uncharacterized membrane protein YdjX (TVP38/TMEM64 family)